MNEFQIKVLIQRGVAALFEHQPNIFEFTSETGQTEWNLAHHLAVELCEYFPELDHDLDVVKRNYGNRRPDIIFHERGTHGNNYLVIEVKRDGDPREIADDMEKIKAYWFQPPLRYEFGAVVNLRADGKHFVEVFKKPN
jgi:hypothetical protein